jgi:hypothetical protein
MIGLSASTVVTAMPSVVKRRHAPPDGVRRHVISVFDQDDPAHPANRRVPAVTWSSFVVGDQESLARPLSPISFQLHGMGVGAPPRETTVGTSARFDWRPVPRPKGAKALLTYSGGRAQHRAGTVRFARNVR